MTNKSVSNHPVLDLEGTMDRLAGDEELFVDLVEFFLEDSPRALTELRTAISANNVALVCSSAHALKGLIAGCGGVRAAQAAQRIESAANEKELSNFDEQFELLAAEYETLIQALNRYRRQ